MGSLPDFSHHCGVVIYIFGVLLDFSRREIQKNWITVKRVTLIFCKILIL